MRLLFNTLYLHCTCSYQLKLLQVCVRHIMFYLFNLIKHYAIQNIKDQVFLIIDAQKSLIIHRCYFDENQFQLKRHWHKVQMVNLMGALYLKTLNL